MIYVIGGLNIDINIKLDSIVRLKESNPAIITKSVGGVSRNIAKALSYNNTCTYITAVPKREEYLLAIKELSDSGIDTSKVLYTKETDSSTYIDIIDDNGLVVGACDMSSIKYLNKEYLESLNLNTSENDIIVFDTNLNIETIKYVLSNYKGIKILEGVSSKKLEKVKELTPFIDIVKVNKDEFDIIKNEKLKGYMITCGNVVGLYYKDYELIAKHNELKLVSPNGCGDTLLGVFVSLMDSGIENALKEGIKAAIACSQTSLSVPEKEDINKINLEELNFLWIE